MSMTGRSRWKTGLMIAAGIYAGTMAAGRGVGGVQAAFAKLWARASAAAVDHEMGQLANAVAADQQNLADAAARRAEIVRRRSELAAQVDQHRSELAGTRQLLQQIAQILEDQPAQLVVIEEATYQREVVLRDASKYLARCEFLERRLPIMTSELDGLDNALEVLDGAIVDGRQAFDSREAELEALRGRVDSQRLNAEVSNVVGKISGAPTWSTSVNRVESLVPAIARAPIKLGDDSIHTVRRLTNYLAADRDSRDPQP